MGRQDGDDRLAKEKGWAGQVLGALWVVMRTGRAVQARMLVEEVVGVMYEMYVGCAFSLVSAWLVRECSGGGEAAGVALQREESGMEVER